MECHLHPGVNARRKCFQCGKPICKACQVKADHHIFCGSECIRAHKWEVFARKADRKFKLPVSRWWMAGTLALLGLLFLLMIQFLLSEFIIPTYSPGLGRKGPGPEIALDWHSDGPLDAFSGKCPEDGVLMFPRHPGNFFWMPVTSGRFRFGCYPSADRPPRAYWLPSRSLDFSLDYARGPASFPLVSLTFDAGAEAAGASEILDLLRDEGIRTTLFLTGDFIHRHPDLVRRILKDGHEVGNLTYSHPRLTTYALNYTQQTLGDMGREKLWDELGRAEQALLDEAGARFSPYWRAPFGEHNDQIRAWAWQRGYLHVSWTWDSLDWTKEGLGAEALNGKGMAPRFSEFERRGPEALHGAILLFHLGTHRVEEVREILNRVKARHLIPVPVSVLLASQAAAGIK